MALSFTMDNMKRFGLYIAILLLTTFMHAQPRTLFTTTHFSARQGLPSSTITAITQDANGAIWIGTTDGLAKFNGSQFQLFDRSTTKLPSNHITALYLAHDNSLWIGTERGIVKESDETFTTFVSANQPILSIDSDREGHLFIQSTTGTFELSGPEFVATKTALNPVRRSWLKESKQFNIPEITTIFIDRESNSWIGTRHGLFLLISGSFALIQMDKEEENHPISFVSPHSTNKIVASDGKKVFIGTPDEMKEVEKLPFNSIYSLFSDTSDKVWTATDKGIFQTNSRGKFIRFSGHIAKDGILLKDSRESLWLAQKNALTLLSSTPKKSFKLGKPNDIITSLLEDSHGILWIGTDNGLYIKKRDNFVRYSTQDGLVSNSVRTIFEDSNGNLWIISTESGITIIKDKQFHILNSLNGLASDTIFSITQSDDGSFWFCSLRGIFSISQKSLHQFLSDKTTQIAIRRYGVGDGLPSLECSHSGQNGATLFAKKNALFATKNGLILIDSSHITTPQPPDATIERVSSDSVPLPLLNQQITIPAGSSILITLSAISIRYPDQIRFAWKFDIPGNEWNSMESRKTLALDDLDPGKYQLRFKASFHDFPLTNSGKEATFIFVVKPRSAIGTYILFFGALFLFMLATVFWFKYRRVNAKIAEIKNEEKTESHTELYPSHLPTKLKQLLEEDALYKDPDLTLTQLAKECSTNTATLSRFINSELHSTFYNLINGYRLEYVKQLLGESEQRERSILALAYQAGFKSKTTFNTMFKRETNLTPTEWRKQKTQ